MEALGDRRVESLLEQLPNRIPRSVSEVGSWLMGKAVEITGIDDPIKAAEMFIQKYGKK